jgi:Fe-Mn family superoxide dismutase
MNKLEPKNYNFSNVKFFSPLQLSEHYVLYTRYIDCLNKVNEALNSDLTYSICNPNYSEIRSAEKSKTFCYDAIKLHELYFENLTGNDTRVRGPIESLLKEVFGSYDNFIEKFKCIALSMRGWVLFCYDRYHDEYYIYGQDSHDDGVMLYAEPLIVLDVYEHAYMIDYGINRGNYIDAFIANLDYGVVNERLRNLNF